MAFTPFLPVGTGLLLAGARSILSASRQQPHSHVDIAGVLVAVLGAIVVISLARVGSSARLRVGVQMGFEVDRRVINAMASYPYLDIFSNEAALDALSILRTEEDAIAYSPRTIGWLVDGCGSIVVALVLLLAIKPLAAGLLVVFLPAIFATGKAQSTSDRGLRNGAPMARRIAYLYELTTAAASGKDIRMLQLETSFAHEYQMLWVERGDVMWKAEWKAACLKSVAAICSLSLYLSGIYVVLLRNATQFANAGDIFVVLGIGTLVAQQMGGTANGFRSIGRSLSVISRYIELRNITELTLVDDGSLSAPEATMRRGIELEDVSFRYSGSEGNALSQLNVAIPPGKVVAVVGENGAGKSSFAKLLLGLYEPSSGEMKIAGRGNSVWEHRSVGGAGKRASAVPQEFARLDLLLSESIGVGDVERIENPEAVLAAMKRAQASELLNASGVALDSQLGARFGGVELSGGQWQRVALSRGLMADDPLLLVMDEPTSALDPLAEDELLEQYVKVARVRAAALGTTTVIVSHRLAIARIADVILVFANGRIVESGSHAELMAQHGHYASLFSAQAQGFA